MKTSKIIKRRLAMKEISYFHYHKRPHNELQHHLNSHQTTWQPHALSLCPPVAFKSFTMRLCKPHTAVHASETTFTGGARKNGDEFEHDMKVDQEAQNMHKHEWTDIKAFLDGDQLNMWQKKRTAKHDGSHHRVYLHTFSEYFPPSPLRLP